MRAKTILLGILISFICIYPVLSQEGKIRIDFSGFGKTKEVFVTVHNTGDTPITDVKISVDGVEYTNVNGAFAPRKGFETTLILGPGNHTISAESTEGAKDSITVNVPEIKVGQLPKKQQEVSFLEKNRTFIIIGIIILFVIFSWMITRQPKLNLD